MISTVGREAIGSLVHRMCLSFKRDLLFPARIEHSNGTESGTDMDRGPIDYRAASTSHEKKISKP